MEFQWGHVCITVWRVETLLSPHGFTKGTCVHCSVCTVLKLSSPHGIPMGTCVCITLYVDNYRTRSNQLFQLGSTSCNLIAMKAQSLFYNNKAAIFSINSIYRN